MNNLIAIDIKNNNSIYGQSPLIPLPKKVNWNNETFDLNKCQTIFFSDSTIYNEISTFKKRYFQSSDIITKSPFYTDKNYIQVEIGTVNSPLNSNEAYELIVNQQYIRLTANSKNGVFNGLQTLVQLINNKFVTGCEIIDYPSFRWRGFMIDVGRNYQSIEQLKEQIDVMSRYKMNIFHFHATENEAWRFEIKEYPQLTSPESMTRDKGKFYSSENIKDLIKYCSERHITFIPELDMPGHSAAFTRAMGFNMQSEEGLDAIGNILNEICITYPELQYIHIGADEVGITNNKFIPTVEKILNNYGKRVISWNPGASENEKNIHQLWKKVDLIPQIEYIDSRYLYISDLEPQSAVVSIFNRKFFDSKNGDNQKIGAEICMWNDRKVSHESELVSMNSVYPNMLAFAERSWTGGGIDSYNYFIGNDDTEQASNFIEFEQRLLTHKDRYFNDKSFLYVKQTHIKWKLFGPFNNGGDLSSSFFPENNLVTLSDSVGDINATGGTIWLRHTWWPQDSVKAWIPNPQENTTWYAYTRFWSDQTTVMSFWIDFKNQSRSGADATPPSGEWDYKKSKIWLNGELIQPPNWKFPGRPSGLLDEPLVDESYFYRDPHKLRVKKGWNTVLVKLPLKDWDPNKDWQEPPKYMFTFIPIENNGINYKSIDLKFKP